MAKYSFRQEVCCNCNETKRICVRTDEVEPNVCPDCKPAFKVEGMPSVRLGWKPTVSKISGFGKSFDDFDRDYDRMSREGA